MKANELRIGCIYKSVKFNMPVPLCAEDIYELVCKADGASIDSYIDEMFEPILLTGERLIEFGFETDGVTFYIKGLNPYRINLFNTGNNTDFNNSGFSVTVYQSKMDVEIRRIQYVHQLQNLWFALTGEELTK